MYLFTVSKAIDADLSGVPARMITTHPLDLVTLEFDEGSRFQVHLSDVLPLERKAQ